MPTPPANAAYTTFQVGTKNRNTDVFTTKLDLNDRSTYYIAYQGHNVQQPEKNYSRGKSLRLPGENLARWQYGPLNYGITLRIQGSTPSATLAAVHTLIQAIENPPYMVRISPVYGSAYKYLTVLAVQHNIPYDPNEILAKVAKGITINFECDPGFERDRVIIKNDVVNPSMTYGAPSPVAVYTDTTIPNFNPYSVQAGSALTQDTSRFTDTMQGLIPLRWFRFDEGGGGTALDAMATGLNGTYTGGVTLGVTGSLTGSTDQAITLDGTTGYVTWSSATSLPTGAGAHAMFIRVKIAANPSATAFVACMGTGGTLGAFSSLQINTSGHAAWSNGNTTITAAGALTTGVWHTLGCTFDGTTMTLWVDGASAGTATPTMALAYATAPLVVGARFTSSYGSFLGGSVDEFAVWNSGIGTTNLNNLNTAATTTPGSAAGTMKLAAGTRILFGSAGWSNQNATALRWRYESAQVATWYLHRTDANNYLAITTGGGTISLVSVIAGVTSTISSGPITLTPEVNYWMSVTQYPTGLGGTPYVVANVYLDKNGAQSNVNISGVNGYSADTLAFPSTSVGAMQLATTGGALDISGITINAFGPSAWSFSNPGSPTGIAAGGWELNQANCYSGLGIQSQGALRIDAAPVGTLSAQWTSGYSGSSTNMLKFGIPATQGQVVAGSIYVNGTGMGSSAVMTLGFVEYNSSGAQLTTGTATTATGAISAWTQISGTYTIQNASTAYVLLTIKASDSTTGSQGAVIWLDNAQVYNQTVTGQTSMPYAEMRGEQLPIQINVTGIAGDMPSKAILVVGASTGIGISSNTTQTLFIGRRGLANSASQLVWGPSWYAGSPFVGSQLAPGLVTDSTVWGGYYLSSSYQVAHITGPIFGNACVPATVQGRFNLLSRAQLSGAATPSSVSAQPFAGLNGTPSPIYDYTSQTPFTANGAWKQVDWGAVNPLWGSVSSAANLSTPDLTAQIGVLPDSTNKNMFFNNLALLPTDAEKQIISISTGSLTTVGNWIHAYVDGYNGSCSFTADSTVASNISDALSVGNNGSYMSVTNSADPVPIADPTNPNAGGLLQYVLAGQDGTGGMLSGAVELWYWPRDLYL